MAKAKKKLKRLSEMSAPQRRSYHLARDRGASINDAKRTAVMSASELADEIRARLRERRTA